MLTGDPKSRGAVLVVDDDEDVRSELRDLLERENYRVVEAGNGNEALDLLRFGSAQPIQLIVLDLVMPCMSGWELIDHLRRDRTLPPIPVLVMSGLPVHGDTSGIGATMSWLRKPFGEDPFLRAVRETIESARTSDTDDDVRRRSVRPSAPSHHDA
jgi:CheY-like chemotaxis protein